MIHGVMVIVIKKKYTATRVQILDKAVCISHSANTYGKDRHPTLLPPALGKLYGRLGSLTLVTNLGEEKL